MASAVLCVSGSAPANSHASLGGLGLGSSGTDLASLSLTHLMGQRALPGKALGDASVGEAREA